MPLVTCPDYGNEISDQAPSCPRCGRPRGSQAVYITKPPKKTNPLLVGCLGLVGLSVLIGIIGSIGGGSSSGGSSSNTTPQASRSAVQERRQRATQQLKQTTDWGDPVAIARLCEQANPSDLPAEAKSHCAEAHLALAKQRLKAGDVGQARQAYVAAFIRNVRALSMARCRISESGTSARSTNTSTLAES